MAGFTSTVLVPKVRALDLTDHADEHQTNLPLCICLFRDLLVVFH
jgi:hypothetical protein